MKHPPNRALRIAIACAAALLAFVPSRAAAGTGGFLVRSWQSEDGLPSNAIRSVVQSADGYLWIATAEGIVRFDGVRFSRFPDAADAVLAQRPPREIFALPGGDVWISTTRGGLLRWDGRRFRVIWKDADAAMPTSHMVSQIGSDGAGGVFIERGGEAYHASASEVSPQRLEETTELAKKMRTAFSAQWLHRSTAPLGVPMELRDEAGRLWARTPGGGLSVSDSAEEYEQIALPEFATGSRITALFEDRERNIWVATNGSGLFQVRARRVSVRDSTDGLADRSIMAILEDRAGALWAASKGGVIDRIVRGQVTHFEIPDRDGSRPFSSLCEDANGTIWAARRAGSVFQWRDGAFHVASGAAMPVWRVSAMVAGTGGSVWFGGEQGLALWSGGVLTSYGAENGIPAQDLCALALDASGELWIGTVEGLLMHGRDGHFANAGVLSGKAISSLLPDADGAVWITTLGAGLFRWKAGTLTRFSELQGLPDERLTCVLDDRAGNLWLGSLAGIFRVAKSELSEIAEQRRTSARWLHLNRSDGMLSSECTGGFQPAGWRGSDGALYFPTVNGIAKVRPATIEMNKLPPPVVIEQARARGHAAVNGGMALNAGPGLSRLEFRYSALSFTGPEKVRFRTQLEGLDDDWHDSGSQRVIAYEAVPPGHYRFRVIGANGDGVWNEAGATIAVVVAPQLWEETWFQMAAAVCAGALAIAIGGLIGRARLRGRMLLLKAQTSRQEERARIAQDLHDDLGASLTEISLLANLATEEKNREHDPLPEIAAKARGLLGTLDEIVWAANPRHDSLASLAEYLAAFATEFLAAAQITLRRDIPNDLPLLPLEPEQRHGIFLAVREALNNVAKHSGASEAWLRFSIDAGSLKITVADNGRGFSTETCERGEGLRNMDARMAGIGGACSLASSTSGTRIVFTLPLAGK